ncbi:ABC transporter permease [Legionella sp. 227]|uniref:ABC transporter permease n=1 Tax=Legionella sp. 227 TaxID=3367288 RepID=UPI00370DC7C0
MMKHTVQDRTKSIHLVVNTFITLLLSLIMNQAIAQGDRVVTKSETGAPRIAGILISDVGNSDGYVSQGKATLPPTQVIYVTVQIFHAIAGLKVQVFIINPSKNIHEHGENVASISGNIAKAFKFNDAAGNWPAGTYKVEVKLSTGDTRITTFELKK